MIESRIYVFVLVCKCSLYMSELPVCVRANDTKWYWCVRLHNYVSVQLYIYLSPYLY